MTLHSYTYEEEKNIIGASFEPGFSEGENRDSFYIVIYNCASQKLDLA